MPETEGPSSSSDTAATDAYGELQAENARLRAELAEVVRQQSEELDFLSRELDDAKRFLEERAIELEERNTRLKQSERENALLIGKLRNVVRQLSTPILHVRPGVLALPITGAVDEERANQVLETALAAVVASQARVVVLDVTGVDAVDASTASHFLTLARGVRMLGAECILSGVRPSMARALVHDGLEMGGIVTVRNLHMALEVARSSGLG